MSQSANGHVSWPNHLRDGSNVTPIRKWEHEIHCESHFHAKFAEIFDQECMGKKKVFYRKKFKNKYKRQKIHEFILHVSELGYSLVLIYHSLTCVFFIFIF